MWVVVRDDGTRAFKTNAGKRLPGDAIGVSEIPAENLQGPENPRSRATYEGGWIERVRYEYCGLRRLKRTGTCAAAFLKGPGLPPAVR